MKRLPRRASRAYTSYAHPDATPSADAECPRRPRRATANAAARRRRRATRRTQTAPQDEYVRDAESAAPGARPRAPRGGPRGDERSEARPRRTAEETRAANGAGDGAAATDGSRRRRRAPGPPAPARDGVGSGSGRAGTGPVVREDRARAAVIDTVHTPAPEMAPYGRDEADVQAPRSRRLPSRRREVRCHRLGHGELATEPTAAGTVSALVATEMAENGVPPGGWTAGEGSDRPTPGRSADDRAAPSDTMSDEPPLDVLTVVQLSDPLGGLATPAPQFVTPEKSAPATCTVMVLPAVRAPALDVSKSSTQEDLTPPTVGAAVRVTAATLPPTAPEGGWATTTAAPTVVINTIAAKPGRTQRPPRSCRPPRRQLRVRSRPNRFGALVNDMPTASSSAFWRPPIGAESPAARERERNSSDSNHYRRSAFLLVSGRARILSPGAVVHGWLQLGRHPGTCAS